MASEQLPHMRLIELPRPLSTLFQHLHLDLFPTIMPSHDLIDYSPQQPEAAAPLATASNVILIDNFDSFSWNIYQYLALEGAEVTVFRNDEINVEELAKLKPTQLVISPGPGHPETDSGVSRDAIKYFAGKIPVFGVCMGQ
jgi:anthranilate synthase/indole-3-glycerol phosphate synthase/phosphoribosylanthranilate isomerase